MIFGRKRSKSDEATQDTTPPEGDDVAEMSPQEAAFREAEAHWAEWDAEFDRYEGPFDIDEVDLHADDVERIDLGTLVATPFEGMQMQINVNNEQVPQSLVVSDGQSALEVAVFGAPLKSNFIPEVRKDLLVSATQQETRISVQQGPFGTDISRANQVQMEDGSVGLQITRTWLVQGPSWLLRGVLFGRAAAEPENEDATIAFEEFFANLVVRRGNEPVPPGVVIPLRIPQHLVTESELPADE